MELTDFIYKGIEENQIFVKFGQIVLNYVTMKKFIILFGIFITIIAMVVVICFGVKHDEDLFIAANVEALSQDEGLPVKTCYIDGWSGEYKYGLFCNTSTSSSMIYPCSTAKEQYGRTSAESKCYN